MTKTKSLCICQKAYPHRSLRNTDYEAFLAEIRERPALFESIERPEHSFPTGILEHFFRCTKCNQTWVYAEPEGPYPGEWSPMQ